jgi:hypothetical protein
MKHRYLLEVADGSYEADDYLIRAFGVECFSVKYEEGEPVPDNFVVYEPITAIHDFAPKLNTIEAFQEMKKSMLEKAHEDWQKAEEMQREKLNQAPASDIDVI